MKRLLLILLLAAAAWGWHSYNGGWLPSSGDSEAAQGQRGGRRGARLGGNEGAIPVIATPARRDDVPVTADAVGTIQALNTVTARTQVDGRLLEIAFKDGQDVKKGDVLATIEEALIDRVLGPQPPGVALAFEDQYISTGGQLYELIMGHDRWIADLRPLAEAILQQRGKHLGLCCHPYDLCTELVAREAGVVVTDARGRRLDAPLDVTSDLAWVGYANPAIYAQVAPVLGALLVEHGLLPERTD